MRDDVEQHVQKHDPRQLHMRVCVCAQWQFHEQCNGLLQDEFACVHGRACLESEDEEQ